MSNFGNNPFGGNYGGGGGGGFVAGGSQGDDGAQKQKNQNLRPVTIYQLVSAEQEHNDAPVMLDGSELEQITLVACVRSINAGSTNTSLTIEDGTGTIDVRMWKDESADEDAELPFAQDTYVRILGYLKAFQNKRSINAASVKPIQSSNEWIYHRLEVIHNYLQATRGPAGASNGAGAGASRARSGAAAKSMGDYGSLTDAGHMAVLDALRALGDDNPDGVHIKQLVKQSGQPIGKVKEATDRFLEDGLCYSTAEEEKFLPMQ